MTITYPKNNKQLAYYRDAGTKARRSLIGRLYSEDILNRVEKALEEFRSAKSSKKSKKKAKK